MDENEKWFHRTHGLFLVLFLAVIVGFFVMIDKAHNEKERADMLQESYTNMATECRKLMAENAELRKLVEDGEYLEAEHD